MDSPHPGSGEEYTHVNTQFFGVIDPPGNRCLLSEQMTPPFNAPERHAAATMDGFVADYISAFTAEVGRPRGAHLGLSDHEEEKLTLIWVAWSTMAACVLGRCCRRRRRTDTVSDSSSCSART